jgi:AraC-like DNA-binding protein
MNAVYLILKNKGNIRMDELAGQCFIGRRHLERLFRGRTDLSPKQFADLIRYQNTWRRILLNRRLDANELVFQLGYTDQSHLLREFKRYHGITPPEAIKFAFGNEKETLKISEQS